MKHIRHYILLFTAITGGLLFSSCADDDEILIPEYHPKPLKPLDPDQNPRADATFEAYTKAFLVTKDGLQFYRQNLSTDEKDYYWGQALDIQMTQDVYWRTKKSTHATLIQNLLNAFIEQNKGNNPTDEWAWNDFNDDVLWTGLAFARGYQITNEQIFLDKAEYAFKLMYDRGWDTALGGGIWWRMTPDNEGERCKSALSNSPAVILGCYLYEFTEKTEYLTKSRAISKWLLETLYRSSDGGVYENIKATGDLSDWGNVYSNGAFVEAMTYMHKITGENEYYNAAEKAAHYVKEYRTNSAGIIASRRFNGTWQSEYLRGLGNMVRENNNYWSAYYDWMRKNANASWSVQREDLGLTWNDWAYPTEQSNKMTALEALGGVIVQQIMPTVNPELFENTNYHIVSKADTLQHLEVAGNALRMKKESEGVITDAMKFSIVHKGYGYYHLEAKGAPGMVLTVNGTTVDFQTASEANQNQYWKLVFDNRRSFKLKPKNNPFRCLSFENVNFTIVKEKHQDNERWIFKQ